MKDQKKPMSHPNLELCFASPVLYPPRGGAEIRFLRYLPGLLQRGINVQLLSGTPKAKKLTKQDMAEDWYRIPAGSIVPTEPYDGVPIHRVRLPDKSGWRRVAIFNQALLRYCREAQQKPDIVQLIEPLSPLAAPWLSRLKHLNITRAFAYTLPYELPENGFKRGLRQILLRLLYSQLDCVVTGSEATRAHALSLGLRIRTEVIPNGVNLQRFRPVNSDARSALRSSLGIDDNAKIITTVGSIIPRKGIDLLLESWASLANRFPELHLVLIGPRTDKIDPKLKTFHDHLVKLINDSGASGRIHFTGRVSNVEMYLQASDLFVFTSEREGMANVVLEAMASELAVVMTPHIGLPPDFGQPGTHYLLADRNKESISTTIEKLLDDHQRCHKLAQNARKWVEETMDLESVLDQYARLYHEISDRKRTAI
jgi:glycosyltransferase involved in cell wall biosynthesis